MNLHGRYLKGFLAILGLTSNIPIDLIGVVKVAELLSLLYVALNLGRLKQLARELPGFRWFNVFLFVWLSIGSLASIFNMVDSPELYYYTPPNIAFMKGAANILFIFVSIAVFVLTISDKPGLVVYYLVPYGLASSIFSPYHYSIEAAGHNNFFTIGSSESVDNYFDMYLAPIITPLVIALPLLVRKQVLLVFSVTMVYGLCALIFDAKAIGFVFVMSAIAIILKYCGFRFSPNALRLVFIFSPLLILSSLIFLAKSGLLGVSSERILTSMEKSEKFNPFLLIGRPDPTIAIVAICDSPLLGHGFNKQDPQYIFKTISLGYLPLGYNSRYKGIPSHSMLLNAMIEGGVFSGLVWLFVLQIAFRGFAIAYRLDYGALTGYLLIAFFYLLWNVLFSGILRLDIGHFIAIIFGFCSRQQLTRNNPACNYLIGSQTK